MKSHEVRLGYLLVASPVQNVYIGGLMIVDGQGLPVEFRYTEPVQPTKLQQILYGSVLSRYIKTDVILDTLLKSLESRPSLIVVDDDSFLFKDAFIKDFDVVRLTETKSSPLKSQSGGYEQISAFEYLLQLTAESSPIRVQLAEGAVSHNTENGPAFEETRIYQQLCTLGQSTDILEPLKRVEKALTVLCQEAGITTAVS